MGDVEATSAGQDWRGYRRGTVAGDPVDQYVVPVEDRIVTYRGRASTFVTPGRPQAQHNLFAIHNATGSTVLVSVNRIVVDLITTVAKAITVQPPLVRVYRFTAVPTNGTALTKNPLDTQYTSSASVTVWGDSSANNAGAGTSSATHLTIATTAGTALAAAYAPRLFTGAGYEMVDTVPFFIGEPDVVLRALQGVVVTLDDPVTTALGNPSTDKWSVFADWTEYTRP